MCPKQGSTKVNSKKVEIESTSKSKVFALTFLLLHSGASLLLLLLYYAQSADARTFTFTLRWLPVACFTLRCATGSVFYFTGALRARISSLSFCCCCSAACCCALAPFLRTTQTKHSYSILTTQSSLILLLSFSSFHPSSFMSSLHGGGGGPAGPPPAPPLVPPRPPAERAGVPLLFAAPLLPPRTRETPTSHYSDKRLLVPAPIVSNVREDKDKKFLFSVLHVMEPPPSVTDEKTRWGNTAVEVLYMKKYVSGGIMEVEVHPDNVPERHTFQCK